MPLYRNYFRNSNGIVGRDEFDAPNDDVALTIAARVFDAVRDRCTSFELWEGAREIQHETQSILDKSEEVLEKTQSLFDEQQSILNES
jgi:hypothetical protein